LTPLAVNSRRMSESHGVSLAQRRRAVEQWWVDTSRRQLTAHEWESRCFSRSTELCCWEVMNWHLSPSTHGAWERLTVIWRAQRSCAV